MRVGWIAGTGFAASLVDDEPVDVDTAFGPVSIQMGTVAAPSGRTCDVALVHRHGTDHAIAPHAIDHRAHMAGLVACDVDAVFAVHNTGGLRPALRAGAIVVPDDMVDMAWRHRSRFGDKPVHVDMRRPFSPTLRGLLLAALRDQDWPADLLLDGGTYIGVPGPRLETDAERRFLATIGDVVGMTAVGEAVAAREAGLPFASLSFVANGPDDDAGADSIRNAMAKDTAAIQKIVTAATLCVPQGFEDPARSAPELGRFH